jgi:hypothetical protein
MRKKTKKDSGAIVDPDSLDDVFKEIFREESIDEKRKRVIIPHTSNETVSELLSLLDQVDNNLHPDRLSREIEQCELEERRQDERA